MSFGATFTSRGTKGYLIRAGLAWILITPAVAAAKIWWSGAAAAVVGVVGVATYIVLATRCMRHHREQPTS
jgi:hypothetical protein